LFTEDHLDRFAQGLGAIDDDEQFAFAFQAA
jgi:hypothetical protein